MLLTWVLLAATSVAILLAGPELARRLDPSRRAQHPTSELSALAALGVFLFVGAASALLLQQFELQTLVVLVAGAALGTAAVLLLVGGSSTTMRGSSQGRDEEASEHARPKNHDSSELLDQ